MRQCLMFGLAVAVACHRPTNLPPATFTQSQVNRVAEPPSERPLDYPQILANAGVIGDVHLQFVIDERGRVDPTTIKALASTHDVFTMAARRSLAKWTARPAERRGRRVRQLTTHAFCFRLVAAGGTGRCAEDMVRYAAPSVSIACNEAPALACRSSTHAERQPPCDETPSRPVPASRCT